MSRIFILLIVIVTMSQAFECRAEVCDEIAAKIRGQASAANHCRADDDCTSVATDGAGSYLGRELLVHRDEADKLSAEFVKLRRDGCYIGAADSASLPLEWKCHTGERSDGCGPERIVCQNFRCTKERGPITNDRSP